MKQYTVLTRDGFRVGVTEGGEGIPLVFLHGFSVSAKAYTEMLELLAANGFHVFAFDAPDHGASDSLPWGHTVKEMSWVIRRAIRQIPAIRWDQVVLVGHSMGGWIAAELAAQIPWQVETLILLNSAVGEEFHENIRHYRSPSAIGKAAQFISGAFMDVVGDARKAGKKRGFCEAVGLVQILRKSVSGIGCFRSAYAMMKSDSLDALKALNGPVRTEIIHGGEDGIVPVAAAWSAAKEAGARITIINAYHSWMISDPERALDIVLRILNLTPHDEGYTA